MNRAQPEIDGRCGCGISDLCADHARAQIEYKAQDDAAKYLIERFTLEEFGAIVSKVLRARDKGEVEKSTH